MFLKNCVGLPGCLQNLTQNYFIRESSSAKSFSDFDAGKRARFPVEEDAKRSVDCAIRRLDPNSCRNRGFPGFIRWLLLMKRSEIRLPTSRLIRVERGKNGLDELQIISSNSRRPRNQCISVPFRQSQRESLGSRI